MAQQDRQRALQKRNKKLAKRKQKKGRRDLLQTQPVSLAYHGNKYKTEQYVKTILDTETAIHLADVMNDGSLTDRDIVDALEDLVLRIRHGELEELFDHGPSESGKFGILAIILVQWQELRSKHSADGFVGVVRTVLSSVETRSSMHGDSRGYLDFIGEWLSDTFGIKVRQVG